TPRPAPARSRWRAAATARAAQGPSAHATPSPADDAGRTRTIAFPSATGRSGRSGSFVHLVQEFLEAGDLLRPERPIVREPVDQRLHPPRLHPVVHAATLAPPTHQPGALQHGKVL